MKLTQAPQRLAFWSRSNALTSNANHPRLSLPRPKRARAGRRRDVSPMWLDSVRQSVYKKHMDGVM